MEHICEPSSVLTIGVRLNSIDPILRLRDGRRVIFHSGLQVWMPADGFDDKEHWETSDCPLVAQEQLASGARRDTEVRTKAPHVWKVVSEQPVNVHRIKNPGSEI